MWYDRDDRDRDKIQAAIRTSTVSENLKNQTANAALSDKYHTNRYEKRNDNNKIIKNKIRKNKECSRRFIISLWNTRNLSR